MNYLSLDHSSASHELCDLGQDTQLFFSLACLFILKMGMVIVCILLGY